LQWRRDRAEPGLIALVFRYRVLARGRGECPYEWAPSCSVAVGSVASRSAAGSSMFRSQYLKGNPAPLANRTLNRSVEILLSRSKGSIVADDIASRSESGCAATIAPVSSRDLRGSPEATPTAAAPSRDNLDELSRPADPWPQVFSRDDDLFSHRAAGDVSSRRLPAMQCARISLPKPPHRRPACRGCSCLKRWGTRGLPSLTANSSGRACAHQRPRSNDPYANAKEGWRPLGRTCGCR